MVAPNNAYCKLFVDLSDTHQLLLQRVADELGAEVDFSTIITPAAELDLRINDEFDSSRVDSTDGFLFYRYFFDIEPCAGAEQSHYVAMIRRLREIIVQIGGRSVAACDFEDDLA